MKRRFFLLAAPAIVAAPSLMRVSTMPERLRTGGIVLSDCRKFYWEINFGPDFVFPIPPGSGFVSFDEDSGNLSVHIARLAPDRLPG